MTPTIYEQDATKHATGSFMLYDILQHSELRETMR